MIGVSPVQQMRGKIEEGKQHFAPLGMKRKRYENRKANILQERKYRQEKQT
jgi:hypothetical protein